MNYIYRFLFLLFGVSSLWACEESEMINTTELKGFTAEAREGAVFLKWEIPVDTNYLFAQVTFKNLNSGEIGRRNASVYRDTMLVDGLLARYGTYEFTLKCVSEEGVESGYTEVVRCQALPVPAVETKYTERIGLVAADLSTNAQEPSEGPIGNLLDGSTDTFFHSIWSSSKPLPHYIEIDLGEELTSFELITNNRSSGSGVPKVVSIQGSLDGESWTELVKLKDGDIPLGGATEFKSEIIEGKVAFIRYVVEETVDGSDFFSLSELEVHKVWFDIYDPENEE